MAGFDFFASLRSVSLTLLQRVIMHTMVSPASLSIAAMRDDEIYALLKNQDDWWWKQRRSLRRLLDMHPDVVFSCGVHVVCHENKAYGPDPCYNSFRLVSHYAIPRGYYTRQKVSVLIMSVPVSGGSSHADMIPIMTLSSRSGIRL
jgi:hypothetical protein